MAEKTTINVMIDGRSFSISGYESSEYLERVAFYVNNKLGEMKQLPSYRRQTPEVRTILLALNIADDYFKAKISADTLEADIESRDTEWYSVKQDLASARTRIMELEKQLASYPDGKTVGEAVPENVPEGPENTEPASAGSSQTGPASASDSDESAPSETGTAGVNEKYLKRSRRYVKNKN
ncbi:MAG: cell division protein ZapA [Bilifractor sp.]